MNTLYRKQIATTIITFLVGGVALAGLIQFGFTMREKQLHVLDIKKQLASYDINKKIFADESKSLESIEARIENLEKYRVTEDSVPALLSSLESMAQDKNVTFAITTVSSPVAKAEKPTLSIDVAARGTFENVTSFLEDLQSQPYEIQFTRFSLFISNTDTEENTTILTKKMLEEWELLASIKIISF